MKQMPGRDPHGDKKKLAAMLKNFSIE